MNWVKIVWKFQKLAQFLLYIYKGLSATPIVVLPRVFFLAARFSFGRMARQSLILDVNFIYIYKRHLREAILFKEQTIASVPFFLPGQKECKKYKNAEAPVGLSPCKLVMLIFIVNKTLSACAKSVLFSMPVGKISKQVWRPTPTPPQRFLLLPLFCPGKKNGSCKRVRFSLY